MGLKRRILSNPKFKHLKPTRFGSSEKEQPISNSEEQQKLEEQEPVVETPILDAAQEEIESEAPAEEEAKHKMTIKKSSHKKKTTTRKPRAKKTATKRKSTKTKV